MILGISGSPRPNSVTAAAVKRVLAESGQETQYISLAGKRINGCISCLGCTKDNVCVVKDDFLPIAEALCKADAIVFGAPNYYDVPNGLSLCLWERCFCFRHQGAFLLQDKPIILISTGYSTAEEKNPVFRTLENYTEKNKMNLLSKVTIGAYSQCYICDYGMTCLDGNIVKNHGLVDVVTPEMLPATFNKQPESILKCDMAGKALQEYFEERS